MKKPHHRIGLRRAYEETANKGNTSAAGRNLPGSGCLLPPTYERSPTLPQTLNPP